ncbi:MAG: TetR/AcrR family transcriptional regulator [Siculibacillus sp.]|nr:TetR/AcrR family transcriptional regulator [Siculibacillus sp.]
MGRKPQRRTKERILETALALFNRLGEPSVTPSAIAEEMGISPGNLHYHFPSKDKIVEALFATFRAEIERTLAAPGTRAPDVEDVWLFLHLIFEAIWKYRFVYRDITALVSRHRGLERQMRLILAHKQTTAATILRGLVAEGRMTASASDIEALAANMTLIATWWLSFEYVRDPRHWDDGEALARGAYQVMALAAPYLAPRERALLDHLAERYRS